VIKQISDIKKKRQTNIKRDKDKQYSTWAKKNRKLKMNKQNPLINSGV
jgi:hypothetical protein